MNPPMNPAGSSGRNQLRNPPPCFISGGFNVVPTQAITPTPQGQQRHYGQNDEEEYNSGLE
jgi:hypothetical protein